MTRYRHFPDSGTMEENTNGEYVPYREAIRQIPAQDSQEGFRAFLARRGVSRFQSLYGAVLHEIDQLEEEAALYKGCCEEWKQSESIRNADLLELIECLPADWRKDSSLETWFPLSAEKLAVLEKENSNLKGYLRAVIEHIAPMLKLYEPNLPEHPVIQSIREYLSK